VVHRLSVERLFLHWKSTVLVLSQSRKNYVRINGEMKLQWKQQGKTHWKLQSEEEITLGCSCQTGSALDPQWLKNSCRTWWHMDWKDGNHMEAHCVKAMIRT